MLYAAAKCTSLARLWTSKAADACATRWSQAQWPDYSPLMSLPGMTVDAAAALGRLGLATLPALAHALGSRQQDTRRQLSQLLGSHVRAAQSSMLM